MGYVNYIYLTICETSLKLYPETKYKSYSEYCKGMSKAIDYKQFSKLEIRHLVRITEILNTVYSLSKEDMGKYVKDYFGLSEHDGFQTSVLLTKKFFTKTGDS